MTHVVRRIGVWSVARIAFFLFTLGGLLGGLVWGFSLWALGTALNSLVPAQLGLPHIPGTVVLALGFVLAPIYGLLGAAAAAVAVALYNAVGALVGGAEVELVPKREPPPQPPTGEVSIDETH